MMTNREKRCQDCACLISKNNIMCCDELWGRPCNEVAEDECPEDIAVEEVEQILADTKGFKVDHGAKTEETAKEKKPRTAKVSDEKTALFDLLWEGIYNFYGENAKIEKQNKLIIVKIGEKVFKLDVIEQRTPKK